MWSIKSLNMKNILYLLIDNYIYMSVKTHMSRSLSATLRNSVDKMCKPHNFKQNFSLLERRDKVYEGFGHNAMDCH